MLNLLVWKETTRLLKVKEILSQKKEMTPINMTWKGKYSEVDYIDSQGFATDYYHEFFDGLLNEINEEVTINDRRND